ncbi:putative solute carrier family 12 member 7 [Triplophysa rosa]|uniref:Solute carrier family 12 member 7 n=1 Tax=Triplophysa rosa TaxID=992332 RepID=A0A9W7T6Y2_TRIRA|nr:putative solute carrier family 12 member 7 [Triplophysa rosa]
MTDMSERFMVVPVDRGDARAGEDRVDGDSVFLDAGAGEDERRGSVPILQYSREPNRFGSCSPGREEEEEEEAEAGPQGRWSAASLFGAGLVTCASRCLRDISAAENFEPQLEQATAGGRDRQR